jgi:hypothetical protein
VHCFCPVDVVAELADGPTGCGEVARGGCLVVLEHNDKFSCTHGGGKKEKTKMSLQ